MSLIDDPELTLEALKIYYGYNEEQMDANTLVNFYVGLVVPAVGAASAAGNLLDNVEEILEIIENLKDKEKNND